MVIDFAWNTTSEHSQLLRLPHKLFFNLAWKADRLVRINYLPRIIQNPLDHEIVRLNEDAAVILFQQRTMTCYHNVTLKLVERVEHYLLHISSLTFFWTITGQIYFSQV